MARLCASFLALLILVLLPAATLAQSGPRSVGWELFDVALDVQANGTLAVAERQAITFQGTNLTQGSRVIPTDRVDRLDNVQVAEVGPGGAETPYAPGFGRAGTFTTSPESDGLHVNWWFPSTSNSTRTFVVRYTASGALRVYPDGDQADWQAIYASRDAPVRASSVTVRLPAPVAAADLKTAWYHAGTGSGDLNAMGQGTITQPGQVRFETGALPANVGAEVRVQFPHGLVNATPPAWQADADRQDWIRQSVAPIGNFLALLLGLAILGGGGGWLVLRWSTRGRDPAVGRVPPRLDRPPSDLPAPLAGTLVDEVADERDAVAILTDLAQRGVVTLADETNPGLAGSQHDVRLTLHRGLNDATLRPYERTLLAGLFGWNAEQDASVLMSAVLRRFAAAIPMFADQLYAAVAQAGLFESDPGRTRARYTAGGRAVAIGGAVLAVLGLVLAGSLVPLAWLPGLALLLVGLLMLAFARSMPRRTRAGALEAARWRAFSAYLRDAAGHDPALVQQYLPYAVAFGVDRSFLRRLEEVGSPPPAWYGRGPTYGPGGVIIMPGGWYGGGWGGGSHGPGPMPSGGDGGGGAPPGAPNPQGWSDALSDLLNAASGAMAHGGGSGGWSGGGWGGGGGGGGGSGGFS